jgi:hypothetical protein
MAKPKFSTFAADCRRALGGKVPREYSKAYVNDAGTHRAQHPAEMARGARQSGQRGDQQRQPASNEER